MKSFGSNIEDLRSFASRAVAARLRGDYMIVLFGSYVKGGRYVDRGSDVDLLVISDDEIEPHRAVFEFEEMTVDFHVLDHATLKHVLVGIAPHGDAFYAEVIRTGICIAGDDGLFVQLRVLAEEAVTKALSRFQIDTQRSHITNLLKDLEWAKSELEAFQAASKTLLETLRLLTLLSGKLPVLLRRPTDNVSDSYQDFLTALTTGFRQCVSYGDCSALCKTVDEVLDTVGGRLTSGYRVLLPYKTRAQFTSTGV